MATKQIPDSEKTSEDWAALPDVVVLHRELVGMVVCAKDGTSIKEIERVANRVHPTGTSSRWTIDLEIEPVPCKDGRPDATHYRLTC